jgi:N-acetylmuramoyl-L-alanine amidase
MPTTVQVTNRYVDEDPVVGAAITFDQAPVSPQTPRTLANGTATVRTEDLTDGDHSLHVIPSHTSAQPVGPGVAEGLAASVRRMFRSFTVNITIRNGRIQSLNVPGGQAANGSVGAGTNPLRIALQPIYFRSPNQNSGARKHEDVSLIVIHQTAGSANIGGTLRWFDTSDSQVSAHYVISAESPAQVVKVTQDTSQAWQAGRHTWWSGQDNVNRISIGIELSHKAKTPWPRAQIDGLLNFLEALLKAYPSIQPHRIVGHMDVLTDANHVLTGRDCPGLEFDWVLLEQRGLGLVPSANNIRIGMAYEGFFRLASPPNDMLQSGDRDDVRKWGGKSWPAPKQDDDPLTTLAGNPIRELQEDLHDIGYAVNVDGQFTLRTQRAVEMFQQHFFAGSRRASIQDAERKKVGLTTAEMIKRVQQS